MPPVPFGESMHAGLVLAKIANVKRITATDAKNSFGGLLEDVATLGRVEIVRHGRVVAIVLSPRALGAMGAIDAQKPATAQQGRPWGTTHMIPPELARDARVLNQPDPFDDD